MTMRFTSPRRPIVLAAIAVATSIGVAACGSSSPQSAVMSTDPAVATSGDAVTTLAVPPTITVMGATTVPTATDASVTSPASHSTTPAATAAPTPTLVVIPTTSLFTIVTLKPIIPILLLPAVNTVSAPSSASCFWGSPLQPLSSVSWTTSNASSVAIKVNGSVVASGLPTSGAYNMIPTSACGQTVTVTVVARWANGSDGGSKSVTIVVG